MVWDLGRAMLKKQEFECARLMDFEFRLRARTMRLLAERLQLPGDALAGRTALSADAAILNELASQTGRPREELVSLHHELEQAARTQLIAERGDPTPYRLG